MTLHIAYMSMCPTAMVIRYYQSFGRQMSHNMLQRYSDNDISCLCTSVKLQNMSWYKTGFVSRQVLHLLSRLQNWICPKTGQYKTCIVSNTMIEASIRDTKPKPWQSHLTSETVEIFIQNEKAVYCRCKAGFGAAGLGSAQSLFWCGRFMISTNQFWSGRFRDDTKPALEQQV